MNEIKLPLNKTQIEILKLFVQPISDDDLKEIKALLVKHLASKLEKKVGDISDKKKYTQTDFDSWLNEPGQ